jgi:hypothetical protein
MHKSWNLNGKIALKVAMEKSFVEIVIFFLGKCFVLFSREKGEGKNNCFFVSMYMFLHFSFILRG